MTDEHARPSGWKQRVASEVIEYWINFLYLAFFLVAFTWYRRLILAEYNVAYTNYWFPLIEAAVLAKVIMIGDLVGLGRGMERRALMVPTLYRTVAFSVWVALFRLVEETIRGLLHGKGWLEGFTAIASKGRYELLASCVVTAVAFIPFFAFRELERVMGEGELLALFWRRAPEPETVVIPGGPRTTE